ncbi:TIGR03067 domain-containing protein [Tundrisphaera lichenicola]|uniref:TIGR03067 domain-containing protein n=1 Tax=Tundrisphaera lichenicola TaxID=2029860 RepID=UPI003EBB8F21
MNRISTIQGLFAFLAISSFAFSDDQSKLKDGEVPQGLIGAYTVIDGEKNGQKESAERIDGITVRFAEDAIVVLDKDKKEVYAQTYKIDTSSEPWTITMKSKIAPNSEQTGETLARGLIEKKGEIVKLIYALPGGEMPTNFKTKEMQLMFVMKGEGK